MSDLERACLMASAIARQATRGIFAEDAGQEAALRVFLDGRTRGFRKTALWARADFLRHEYGRYESSARRKGRPLYLEDLWPPYAKTNGRCAWEEWIAAPEESPGLSETALRVRSVLSQMRPDHREVLEQVLMEGRTVQEYADEIGRSQGTIGQRLVRARRAFEALWARAQHGHLNA